MRTRKVSLGAPTSALAGAALSIVGCSASPAPTPVTIDCSILDGYIFKSVENYDQFNDIAPAPWFSYGDNTPGGRHSQQESPATGGIPPVKIEGDGLCGSKNGLVLVTEGHQDYGSGFGSYCLNNDYNGPAYSCRPQVAIDTDGTPFEGFSFWARDPALHLDHIPGEVTTNIILDAAIPEGGLAPGDRIIDGGEAGTFYDAQVLQHGTPQGPFAPTGTSKTVTVAFDDRHTTNLANYYNQQIPFANNGTFQPIANPCTVPQSSGLCQTITDSQGVMTQVGSGCVLLPNQCGNSFTRTLLLGEQWKLYLLPFASFGQTATPARTSEPVDQSTIFTFAVRMPKEAVDEVWIARLGFYRKKP